MIMLNGKDSFWLQLEVCREYQRARCTRSDGQCKFAHPPTNVEVQSNGRVTACYDSIKGRCQRESCKYMHPPAHLKDQLLINGRNHLALKNALLAQHQHHPNHQNHFHVDPAASLSSTAPASSAALFQSAVVAAAAHRQQQLAAAAAAAAVTGSPPHPLPPAALRLAKSPGQPAGLVDAPTSQAPPPQPPQPQQEQQAHQPPPPQPQHPHPSQHQPQPQPPSQQQQQPQPHQLAFTKHASPTFDLSMQQANPTAALAAAIAASSMNPFMTPGAFTHTYASQYAAAMAAAAAAQQQRHQLGAGKLASVPTPVSAPKLAASFPSHAVEPSAGAPDQLAAAYYMTPAAMAAAAASFVPFSAAASTNGYLTALYAGTPSPLGQCDKRPARGPHAAPQAPAEPASERDQLDSSPANQDGQQEEEEEEEEEEKQEEEAKKRLKTVKANGLGQEELEAHLLRHDCCAHASHSKSAATSTSSTPSSTTTSSGQLERAPAQHAQHAPDQRRADQAQGAPDEPEDAGQPRLVKPTCHQDNRQPAQTGKESPTAEQDGHP